MKKETRLKYFTAIILTIAAMFVIAPAAFAQSAEDIISSNQIILNTYYFPKGVSGEYEYSTDSMKNTLYKINRKTKKKTTLVKNFVPGMPSIVTVYKNYVYYNGYDSKTKKSGTFRIGCNGKNKKQISTVAINFIISNNKFFYESNNSIYSANLDGSKVKKVVSSKSSLYIQAIAGNRIYYSTSDKNGGNVFLCYDIKTKKTIDITKKFDAVNIIGFDGDKIYINNYNTKTKKHYVKYYNIKTGKMSTVCQLTNQAESTKYFDGKLFYQIVKTNKDDDITSVSLKSYNISTKKTKTYYTSKDEKKSDGNFSLFGKYLYGYNGYQAKVR